MQRMKWDLGTSAFMEGYLRSSLLFQESFLLLHFFGLLTLVLKIASSFEFTARPFSLLPFYRNYNLSRQPKSAARF